MEPAEKGWGESGGTEGPCAQHRGGGVPGVLSSHCFLWLQVSQPWARGVLRKQCEASGSLALLKDGAGLPTPGDSGARSWEVLSVGTLRTACGSLLDTSGHWLWWTLLIHGAFTPRSYPADRSWK